MFDKALPTPFRIAQAIGLTGSIFATGFAFACSYAAVPALLQSPSPALLTKQWRTTFYRGMQTALPTIAVTSLSYFYLSYRFYAAHKNIFSGEWRMNLLAGVAMLGGAGYTGLVMGGTNGKLLKKAEELEGLGVGDEVVELGGETAHALVDRWATLNMGRTLVFLTSALAGTYAALG